VSRRIGKRTREAAIHCLEQCASDRISMLHNSDPASVEAGTAKSIAELAWTAVYRAIDPARYMSWVELYLEAAAILRDGWNPGDPVEVRR